MILLTDSELKDICNFVSVASYIYYPEATEWFSDMYNTGCRPLELLDVTRWSYDSVSTYTLVPLKGNSNRLFNQTLLSTALKFAIANGIKPYAGLSYRQLRSVLYKIIPVIKVQTANKSAVDYMFRYNFIKKLHNAGSSDAAIQAEMGWSDVSLSASYYGKALYRLGPLPPPIPTIMTLQQAFDASITAGDLPQITQLQDTPNPRFIVTMQSADSTIFGSLFISKVTCSITSEDDNTGTYSLIQTYQDGKVLIESTGGIIEVPNLIDAVDDTAAAAAGVTISGLYRNGSVMMVRVT